MRLRAHRSPWRIVLVVIATMVAIGFALIAITHNQTGPREVGISIATGGVTGIVFMFVQSLVQEEGERQQLLLRLSATQDLTGLNLRRRHLDELTLVGKQLPVADLSEARLRFCRFVGVDLRWATLRGSDFTGSTFAYANLNDTDLRGTVFKRADLRMATFSNVRLAGATLFDTDLAGADLSSADLTGASIDRVHYDAATRWPEGFRPPPADREVLRIHVDQPDWHDYWRRYGRRA